MDPVDDAGADDGDDGDDGEEEFGVTIEGLDGPVDVYFDDSGILHARCASDADCFAAEGYFHAAHRFIQMDIRRRLGRGRLAELVGELALGQSDIPQRRMMTARDGTPLEEKLLANADEQTLAALDAYARGVNAWLADVRDGANGAVLMDEYSASIIDPDALAESLEQEWEALDSVACILPLVDQLTNFADTDIALGDIYGALADAGNAQAADDLFGLRVPSDSSILPPEVELAGAGDPAAARRVGERMARARPLLSKALAQYPNASLDKGGVGSNNWVVGPEQTGGGALLANDPHLAMSHPSIWYIVHLDAKSSGDGNIHVAGASFPGLPGIILGQNEDVAWGATTTFFDSTDVYVETLNEDGTAVIFDGEEVPLQEVAHTFQVAGGEPVEEIFQIVPHHGPIVEVDKMAGTALSVRWAGHDADTDINFFMGLATATTVEEARTALEACTTCGQNFVVIDRGGNIGWFPYNRLPTRDFLSPELPSWLPLPGDGSAEWGDWIPYADLPQAINPAAGYLATANNDMTGRLRDGNPLNEPEPWLQGLVDEGYRHQRIVERLEERSDHDIASMQSIQGDVFSLIGELLVPRILEIVDPKTLEADGQLVYDALAAWDFQCTSGIDGTDPAGPVDDKTAASARGCLAFHTTWARIRTLAFGDELGEAGLTGRAREAAVIFALTDPTALSQDYWNDVTTGPVEDETDIVAAALNGAGAFLRGDKRLGEPDNWQWGRVHTVTLTADLFSLLTPDYNSAAYANDGGMSTVDVANPANEAEDDYSQSAGPSMRLACQADEPGVNCTIELPGGQRHLRDSPFFTAGENSMLDEWLANQPVPIVFAIDEVAAGALETVTVQPR